MTLAVVWLPAAMNAYRLLRVKDSEGARRIARRIAVLAAEPHPEESSCLGETDFRRLRLDQQSVLYEVTQPGIVRARDFFQVSGRSANANRVPPG
jgi:hypothetical protein